MTQPVDYYTPVLAGSPVLSHTRHECVGEPLVIFTAIIWTIWSQHVNVTQNKDVLGLVFVCGYQQKTLEG